MTYATLMVYLDGAGSNAAVLDAAATLARQYTARVIGIAACQPVQIGECDGTMDGAIAVAERAIVTDELARAKIEFHAHAGLKAHVLEWRSITAFENIAHVVAEQARCADLIITGAGPTPGSVATRADAGDLILRAGRPVLVVPHANVTADFRNVVVAWANTRECRRAFMDALPMLHAADCVTLAEVSSDPLAAAEGIRDIFGWLKRHRITADRLNVALKGSRAETLATIATKVKADLVVAGAYGHSRIREWAFGGVTRDLLLHEPRCTFMSH